MMQRLQRILRLADHLLRALVLRRKDDVAHLAIVAARRAVIVQFFDRDRLPVHVLVALRLGLALPVRYQFRQVFRRLLRAREGRAKARMLE